jgi:Zn-dependent peptidase ImmA (M78 family)
MIDNIQICGLRYEILLKTAEEMEGRVGLANFNTQEIWINQTMTDQTKKIAVYHEVLHMLDHAYNLKLSEEQVTFTAHALLALVSDNQQLVNGE